MKIALFALFFLVFTSTKAELVYDTDGNPIPKGASYYILTGPDPIGSAYLSLLNYGKQSSPSFVVDSVYSPNAPPRLPAKFWSDMLYHYTLTDLPLNFTFPDTPQSDGKLKWYVSQNYFLPEGYAVFLGDIAAGTPGDFKITAYGKNYKIIFCPKETPETCGDLSVYEYRGNRFLHVIYDQNVDPLVVRFQKVDASTASGISMVV